MLNLHKCFLDYVRPMYGERWDRDFEARLLRKFELPPRSRLRDLSRGQRMKTALLSSLAYRPRLVVLDEPFAGHAAQIAAVFPHVRQVTVRRPGLRELFVSLARDSRTRRNQAKPEVAR
jgi:ABC-type glutathione transport system ATPase component